jgi:hypothetical protein
MWEQMEEDCMDKLIGTSRVAAEHYKARGNPYAS